MQVSDWNYWLVPLLSVGTAASVVGILRGIAMWQGLSLFEGVAKLFEDAWNGIKSALYWLAGSREHRTFAQRKYNTDMTWIQVRWSIARLEHEMLPHDQHTHEVDDCVHPDCNPEFLEKMATLAWESISKVPILRKPPPPPPPRRSRGGPVTASEMRLPPWYNEAVTSYTCLTCGRTSYHPANAPTKYCGKCHKFEKPF